MPRQTKTPANENAPRVFLNLAYWREFYDPTHNGVHICGISYQRTAEGEFQTVANFPSDHPRALFEQLREFAVPHEQADLVVDLCIDGDIGEDFSIRRQSVELIKRKLRAA
jgi:hypothetical protein